MVYKLYNLVRESRVLIRLLVIELYRIKYVCAIVY